MAKTYPELSAEHIAWIADQPMFFVASAPSSDDGHVNVSPKGYDTFRVLDPLRVAYLDLTGSGTETIAHLRQNGRVTIMFCAFEGRPRVLRLYGRGRSLRPDDDGFGALMEHFEPIAGTRSIVTVDLELIRTSCGYAIPLMEMTAERETLVEWAEKKGESGIADYWARRNTTSIDGLDGVAPLR